MKKYILLITALYLGACNNNDDYTTNDPSADVNASSCYDVSDVNVTYQTFFRPKGAWVGDPMPFYDNGKFYIYYLHDTRPAGNTFHPWFLATSSDFFTYEDKGEVIACGEDNSQEDALGTGSIIKNGNTYYAFYTGHNGNLDPKEKIFLATSTDLVTWEKKGVILQAPDKDYDRNEFRDPFVFKDGAIFRMLVTTRGYVAAANDWQAVIANYTSSDLVHWQLQDPYYYNGERILECPDVFTMGEYQYLIYSNWDWADRNRRVIYRYRKSGSSQWIIPQNDVLDGDLFYGGKTTFDGTNRYLTSWIPTREAYKDNGNFSWGGSLAVHQLAQNADGTLRVVAPHILTSKMTNNKQLGSVSLQENQTKVFDRLSSSTTKIATKITAETSTQFGLRMGACGTLRETYDIVFDMNSSQLQFNKNERGKVSSTITAIKLPIPNNKEFNVTLIVEGSVAVVYVNDQVALSLRSYRMNQNVWGVFTKNGTTTFSDITISN